MREDTPRYLGNFTAVSLLMFLLLISSLVSDNSTFASSQTAEGQFPQSIIAASSTDTTPHTLELRAIQDGDNAEPRKVSQFKLDMTNVVTAQVNSQLLVFLTDSSVKVLEAKVRTVSDQLIDLVPTIQANAFSLANLPVGVYTLDIITQKGNAKAAYEGILVISQRPTTIINETTKQIINQEINQNSRVDIDTKIIFKEDTPESKPPIEKIGDNDNDRCIVDKGYRLSKGSYINNGRSIVGSPCDPVEFCKDKNSADPIVIDHCDDIWDDVDDPKPVEGCQPEDDYCGPGCESPTVDCIDDVNKGDDGDDCKKGFVAVGSACVPVDDFCTGPCGRDPDAGIPIDDPKGGIPMIPDVEEDYTIVDERPDGEENKDDEVDEEEDKLDPKDEIGREPEPESEPEEEEEEDNEEEEEKQVNDSN